MKHVIPTPNLLSIFVLLVTTTTVVLSSGIKLEGKDQSDYLPVGTSHSTTCGDLLTGTNGTITYKTDEFLGKSERCIWVIRGGNVSDYHIAVFKLGFAPSANHQLTITGLAGDYLPTPVYTIP